MRQHLKPKHDTVETQSTEQVLTDIYNIEILLAQVAYTKVHVKYAFELNNAVNQRKLKNCFDFGLEAKIREALED